MKLLWDKVHTDIGYGGAGNGGKSYLGCSNIGFKAMTYPETAYLIGRKDFTNLKRTTFLTFYEMCKNHGIIPNKHFKYNDQSHITTFINGSMIFWLDLDYYPSDPLYTRLGSLNLTEGFIDESNEVKALAIDTVKSRLGRKNNDKYGLLPKLLETFNPDKGHVKSKYVKPYKDGTLPTNTAFVPSLSTDNPHATEEWRQQILGTRNKVMIERLLKGNFDYDDDPNTMISNDAILDLYTNTLVKEKISNEKYLIVDAARYGGDRIVFAFWKGLEWYKVVIKRKQGIDETIEDIKNFSKTDHIPFSHILTDEDGVGGGIVDGLRGTKGFVANRKPFENKSTGKPDNYKSLKDQCAYKLADLVNDHKISIKWASTEISESLNEELSVIKFKDIDKEGKKRIQPKDEMKEVLGRSPDLADTMLMRMYFELKPQPSFVTDNQPAYQGGMFEYSESGQREEVNGFEDDLGITHNFKFKGDD